MNKADNPNYTIKIIDGKAQYVRKNQMKAFDWINYTILGLFALICILPCVYELLLSFSSKNDYLNANLFVLPKHFNLENYKVTLYQDKIFQAFGVSLLVTIGSVVYSLVLTSLGAYAFTKKDVPGLKIIFFFIICTMFFGGGLVPFYLTVNNTVARKICGL